MGFCVKKTRERHAVRKTEEDYSKSGCQWNELPIDKNGEGLPETPYTRIYSAWRGTPIAASTPFLQTPS